jgi:hypothetical protein
LKIKKRRKARAATNADFSFRREGSHYLTLVLPLLYSSKINKK